MHSDYEALMLYIPVPVNGDIRPVDAPVALPARPTKHRPSRKKKLALLAADIRRGEVPTQRALAHALGISVAMISAAEILTPAAREAVAAGERPLMMPTGLARLPAPAAQPDIADDNEIVGIIRKAAKAALPDMITDQALDEIVRVAGVDRVLAAVEPHLS
jgi:hypothetical protein